MFRALPCKGIAEVICNIAQGNNNLSLQSMSYLYLFLNKLKFLWLFLVSKVASPSTDGWYAGTFIFKPPANRVIVQVYDGAEGGYVSLASRLWSLSY